MQEIYINGRFYSQKITGVQRYSRELIVAIDDIIPDLAPHTNLTCLVPIDAADLPELQNIRFRKVGPLTGNLWEQIELPFYARRGLLFSPANTGPVFSGPQVVTLHDASVYAFGEAYSALFKFKI